MWAADLEPGPLAPGGGREETGERKEEAGGNFSKLPLEDIANVCK